MIPVANTYYDAVAKLENCSVVMCISKRTNRDLAFLLIELAIDEVIK